MNKLHEWVNTGLIAIVAILVLVGGNHQTAPGLGGTTNYDTLKVTALSVGSGCNDSYGTCIGSTLTKLLSGTMTCATGASTITALASSTYQCAVTNVVPGDKVFVTLAASTTPDSIILVGASASSTANGFIVLQLANMSTSTKNVAGATSSVQYLVTTP